MSVIYIVLPLALVIAGAAIVAFVWAVRSGQFDDTETPVLRMLHDDEDESQGRGRPGPAGGASEKEPGKPRRS